MNAVVAALVAILTERNTEVLQALFDVVGIRGLRRATNATRQQFNACKVVPLGRGQFVVQLRSLNRSAQHRSFK
jgi:hypothetical protein